MTSPRTALLTVLIPWLTAPGQSQARFVQVAEECGITEVEELTARYGHGLSLADFDRDGDLDLYLINITRQYYGQQQHNRLLTREVRKGRLHYIDRSQGNGVAASGWDWGTTFSDVNNDGYQDLLTTNGWWDEYAYPRDRSRLWLGSTAGFHDVSVRWGFDDSLRATTLLSADLDRDGDQDILQTLKTDAADRRPLLLYLNTPGARETKNNYLTVRPRMPGPNHYAIGSVVTLVGERTRTSRLMTAGTSFYGQEPAEAHFGLGQHTGVREISVRWPDQTVTTYVAPQINQLLTLNYERLPAPSQLRAVLEDGLVRLRWEDRSATETSFEVQRSGDSTFTDPRSATVPRDAIQYGEPQPVSGGQVYYRLRACRGGVCSDYSNQVRLQLPVSTDSVADALRLYPNPAVEGRIHWEFSGSYRGSVSVTLIGPLGRVHRRYRLDKREDRLTGTLNAWPLPPGIYILRAGLRGRTYTQNVMLIDR
ncbi:ASPIC/UnbV domain-containing protein [Neolewinella sp.]|uniref:ASPIC/UnbV domain-containing protein n=1 Tax=Neolewinella sp. TaxID=2993543 RepID=UPI003B517CD1